MITKSHFSIPGRLIQVLWTLFSLGLVKILIGYVRENCNNVRELSGKCQGISTRVVRGNPAWAPLYQQRLWHEYIITSKVFMDVIIHSCLNLNGGLTKPPLKLGVGVWLTKFPTMHMFHIPQYNIQNRNVNISVLNVALWDIEHVYDGIC